MKTESRVRIFAGTLVLLSLALTYYFNPWWLALAAFVGVNLIQSAFTNFCFAETLLRQLRRPSSPPRPPPTAVPMANP
jgi:hypothetical protein